MGKVFKAENVWFVENWSGWNCTHAQDSVAHFSREKCLLNVDMQFKTVSIPRKEISVLKLSNDSVYRLQVEAQSITKDSTILSEKED